MALPLRATMRAAWLRAVLVWVTHRRQQGGHDPIDRQVDRAQDHRDPAVQPAPVFFERGEQRGEGCLAEQRRMSAARFAIPRCRRRTTASIMPRNGRRSPTRPRVERNPGGGIFPGSRSGDANTAARRTEGSRSFRASARARTTFGARVLAWSLGAAWLIRLIWPRAERGQATDRGVLVPKRDDQGRDRRLADLPQCRRRRPAVGLVAGSKHVDQGGHGVAGRRADLTQARIRGFAASSLTASIRAGHRGAGRRADLTQGLDRGFARLAPLERFDQRPAPRRRPPDWDARASVLWR